MLFVFVALDCIVRLLHYSSCSSPRGLYLNSGWLKQRVQTDLVALRQELVPEGCFKLPKRPVCGLPALGLHRVLRTNKHQDRKESK